MASETEGLVLVCGRACARTPDICQLRTKFRFRGLGFIGEHIGFWGGPIKGYITNLVQGSMRIIENASCGCYRVRTSAKMIVIGCLSVMLMILYGDQFCYPRNTPLLALLFGK